MKRLAALAAFKLSLFLKDHADLSLFSRYPRLISADVTEEELASYPEEPSLLYADSPKVAARYQKIYDACGGDPIALTAIQLSILADMDERTLTLLREGLGTSRDSLTIETAARIALRSSEILENLPALRSAYDKVELLLQAEPGPGNFLKTPFHPDGRLASWLSGEELPDRSMQESCTVFSFAAPAPAFCRLSQEIQRIADLGAKPGFSLFHISGERTSGRRFFAQEAARKLGRNLLVVPYSSVSENGRLLAVPWRRVLRELFLTDQLLCLCDVDCSAPPGLPSQLRLIERGLAPLGRPVFLTTTEDIRILPFLDAFVAQVPIHPCSISESAALWDALARENSLSPQNLPIQELSVKMVLTAGQINRILCLLSRGSPQGPWDARDIFKLCYQVLDDGRYQNIRVVKSWSTWEELRLEPYQKQVLRDICDQVENQGVVLDNWGLRPKYPYGRCVSALFSGPPGTGKTMAAQVLAGTLGLELYKIDLSQIVDKYIGETEKRLKEVFDRAEKSNMILFFDEGDALFGKRSEVKDAKDKYANTEVAYLLQRMEEYSGIVLMATNLANQIDSAFVRRFRYHIPFTLPGESLRRDLWHDVLPSSVPQKGIDFAYLARQFELPGSQIKNIALNACYKAAADGGILSMKHLVEAVFLERQKEGKVMLASEFGEYGNLLYDLMERMNASIES